MTEDVVGPMPINPNAHIAGGGGAARTRWADDSPVEEPQPPTMVARPRRGRGAVAPDFHKGQRVRVAGYCFFHPGELGTVCREPRPQHGSRPAKVFVRIDGLRTERQLGVDLLEKEDQPK